MKEILNIIGQFKIEGEVIDIFPYGNGLINKTYKVVTSNKNYLLQEMNSNVFTNPKDIIYNIELVSDHIRNKGYQTLKLISSVDGNNYVFNDNKCYRIYDFIENSKTLPSQISNHVLELVSYYYGRFTSILSDFDVSLLNNNIPEFHNTLYRYNDMLKSIKDDEFDRAKEVVKEIEYLKSCKDYYSIIVDKLNSNELPYRVCHNDTKIDNLLVDYNDELLSVIDFDTLMPGSLLYDFGDLARSSLLFSMDERKNINLDTFKCVVRGFYNATKQIITKEEISLLATSIYIITLELAMRFLTDYLKGDKYFKSNYIGHNLDRCKKQISLSKAIFVNLDKMNQIVKDICN